MTCTEESINGLMLDALRRGILLSRGGEIAQEKPDIGLSNQKRMICQIVSTLMKDQKMQICLAIAHIGGIESLGEHNQGCHVDLTDWDAAKIKKLMDVIRFVMK
jgi:hypothetical protein